MMPSRVLLLTLVSLALAACAVRTGGPPPWRSPLGREHPLTGRVWDVAARRFLDPKALVARLARARFVLLGEKHDNADHHRLQAWTIEALVRAGRRPAVALEMLAVDKTAIVERYRAATRHDAAGLGAALDWGHSGWPPWPLYQPIAEAALGAGLPIVGADLTREQTRAVLQDGIAALDAAFVARTGLDRPPSAATRKAMVAEISEAHCGYAPESMLDGMIAVQRGRDAQLADSLARAGARDGAVLIAGNGHVPKDRGVPAFLAVLRPDTTVEALAFVEVRDDLTQPEGYLDRPVDYAWFTPRVDDLDPCRRFRKPLQRLREPRTGGAGP